MGNRSNINLVGNTTQGQNLGVGEGVYKGKDLGNTLQYKSLSVTGTTMVITSDADNIYFSAATGSGSGTITSGANGLSTSGANIVLGGTLTGNTTIAGASNDFNVTGASDMNLCGEITTLYGDFAMLMGSDSNISMVYNCNGNPSCKSGIGFNEFSNTLQDDVLDCGMSYYTDYSTIGCTNPRWIPDWGAVTGYSGGGGYWSQNTGYIYPSTSGDDIRLDNATCIYWSGTTGCVTATETSGNTYMCMKNNTSCVAIGPTGIIVLKTAAQGIYMCTGNNDFRILYPTACSGGECALYVNSSGSVVSGSSGGGASAISGWTCVNGFKRNVSIGNGVYPYNVDCFDTANIIIGNCVMTGATSASNNVIIGTDSFLTPSDSASNNIGIGYEVLTSISTGTDNIGIGFRSLFCTNTGIQNVGYGAYTLADNTDGDSNVAIGTAALCSNSIGCSNIAVGAAALGSNTIGSYNTVIGTNAFCANVVGCTNTVIGTFAGFDGIGCGNVFLGYQAGYSETGDNFLYIANSGSTFLVKGCFSNNTICNGGDSASWDTSSDCRIKESVTGITNALSTISNLNPITFDYTTGYTAKFNWDENRRICNYGFLAQEFETIFPKYVKCSEDAISCVSGSTVSDFRTMNTGHLIPILVKAIQELEARIQALEA